MARGQRGGHQFRERVARQRPPFEPEKMRRGPVRRSDGPGWIHGDDGIPKGLEGVEREVGVAPREEVAKSHNWESIGKSKARGAAVSWVA